MRWVAILSVGAAFLLSGSAVFAEDRLVPSQYATIEAAISAAGNGDRVIISPGLYNTYGLDFAGKAITVTSEDPDDWAVVEATVIDCGGLGRAFHFHSSETALSVLAGLTITDGNATSGGAIDNEDCSPTITNCIFTDNTAEWYGGAVQNYQSSPTVSDCILWSDSAPDAADWRGMDYSELLFEVYSRMMSKAWHRHPHLRKALSMFKWGINSGKSLEKWGRGIDFLDEWHYIDRYPGRWRWMRLFRLFPPLHKVMKIVHLRLNPVLN